MLLKTKLIVAALAVLLIGLLGFAAVHEHGAKVKAKEAARTAQKATKAIQATDTLREAQRKRTAVLVASQRASLDLVLLTKPDWANAAVPQEVQDELCKTVRCTSAIPGRLPEPTINGSP